MYRSLIFWILLTLPGYVVVRTARGADACGGFLGMLGLSFLATLGLLSPISIACYLFGAPLWVFSAGCGLLVAAALGWITWRGWWVEVGELLAAGMSVELVIILLDGVVGATVGAFLHGDAVTHLARIRTLQDHGFNNSDPFLGPPFQIPAYHTSLFHALYAACSQLSGADRFAVWFVSLGWAKLLVASSMFYLGRTVFDRDWAGYLAAFFMLGCCGPVTFLNYPNQLAPLYLIPFLLAFCVQLLRPMPRHGTLAWVAMTDLVIAQVHGLYAAFAGLLLGPTLIVLGTYRIARRRSDAWVVLLSLPCLAIALPFVLAAASPGNWGAATVESPETESASDEPAANIGSANESGRATADGRSVGWRTLVPSLLAAVAVGRRRRSSTLLAAAIVIAAVALHVPPMSAIARQVFREEWILRRLGFVMTLGAAALLPVLVPPALERRMAKSPTRWMVACLALGAGAAFGAGQESASWKAYVQEAGRGGARGRQDMHRFRWGSVVLARHVPPGTCVLAEGWTGMTLCMLHDCRIVARRSTDKRAAERDERQRDLAALLSEETTWPRRRELLQRYGIRYFYPGRLKIEWPRGHTQREINDGAFRILVLQSDG